VAAVPVELEVPRRMPAVTKQWSAREA
jgi:hypothetical protein